MGNSQPKRYLCSLGGEFWKYSGQTMITLTWAALVVVPEESAAGIGGVDDVRVGGLDGHLAALRQADGVAVVPRDDPLDRAAGNADGAVVLLRAVDAVWDVWSSATTE